MGCQIEANLKYEFELNRQKLDWLNLAGIQRIGGFHVFHLADWH